MIRTLLTDLGINLDEQTLKLLDEHFHETLHASVIERVIKTLNESQIKQLSEMRTQSNGYTWEWLKQNVPDLDSIVKEEVYMLIGDVIEHSDSI